jgi:inhibitor of cysteine peptidase
MESNGNIMMGIVVLIVIVIVAVTTLSMGCSENMNNSDGANNTINDTGESDGYIYSNAVVEEVDIRILESFPVQVHAVARGYLPDGCTVINENATTVQREGNTFNIYLETIRPEEAVCIQALVPFEQNIPLNVYGLEKGTYTVNVNGIEETFELAADNILQE